MKGFWEGFYQLEQRVRPYLLFTALNTVWRHLDRNSQSLLDVGCGQGKPALFLKRKRKVFMVGIDVFLPYLQEARQQGTHDAYVLGDVRCLPFREKGFDTVLGMEVLEHLNEEEGLGFIEAIGGLAKRQVIVTTPVGSHTQESYDDNLHQEHQHIWQPRDLKQLGYRVRGHGIRNMGGMSGIQSPLPKLLRPLMNVLWVLAGPVTYFIPKLGGNMVGIKDLWR